MSKLSEQDKWLLLKDLCARFPYKLMVNAKGEDFQLISINDYRLLANPLRLKEHVGFSTQLNYAPEIFYIEDIKPYLRPMSSMTEEEKSCYQAFFNYDGVEYPEEYIDWLNAHYFDYRRLIEKDLALEAPEEMYNIK